MNHVESYKSITGLEYAIAPTPKNSDGTIDTNDKSNKIATTEWVNEGYLPLSGGTITGSINLSNNGKVGEIYVTSKESNDWRYATLMAIDADGKVGGSFRAFMVDSPNHAGGFTVRAERPDRFCDLYGTPDGILQWNNHNITHVIETWVSSDSSSWYRKWSDGWLEQGGKIVVSNGESLATAYHTTMLTFPIPFTNLIRWQCQARHDCFIAGFNTEGGSVSTVEVYQKNTQEITFRNMFNIWYACGY